MSKTVVGSFDTFDHARDVVDALERMGVAHSDLNVVANDAAGQLAAGRDASASTAGWSSTTGTGTVRDRDVSEGGDVADDAASSAGRGAVAGGVIGGTAGLIAGLAGLAVPGIGPLVAAGPIAAALTGAGIGAIAGGLIGGLRAVGVSDSDAEYYAEAVRRGGALVVVKADDTRADEVADTMRLHGAIDIESRVAAWRESGWSGFDESASPYTHEQIERERVAYRTGGGMPQAVSRSDDDALTGDLRSGTMTGRPVAGTTTGVGLGAGTGGSTIGGTGVGTGAAGSTIGGDTVGSGSSAGGTIGGDTVAGGTIGTGSGLTGTSGSGTLGGGSLGTGTGTSTSTSRSGSEHPNLGSGSDRPGVDTRSREHGSRAGMSGGGDEPSTGSGLRDTARRASDAIERRIPGDSDGDGR